MAGNTLMRLKAVVLVVLLLSGGGGMPLLDLALFHSRAATHFPNPHFEASDAFDGHGDYCRQGTALPHAPGAARFDPSCLVVAATFKPLLGASVQVLPSADPGLLPRPRAPPPHRA
jgi:hypothetical protein